MGLTMPNLGSTTLLRGFKVSITLLDAFLAANCVPETFGTPPFCRDHPHHDSISKLLYSRFRALGGSRDADPARFRLVIPSRAPYNASRVAYVTYVWVTVYAHREVDLDGDLRAEPPEGFEELRQEILSAGDGMLIDSRDKIADEGKMGVYMAYTFEIRGSFTPSELLDRKKVSCRPADCILIPAPPPFLFRPLSLGPRSNGPGFAADNVRQRRTRYATSAVPHLTTHITLSVRDRNMSFLNMGQKMARIHCQTHDRPFSQGICKDRPKFERRET